MAPVGFLDGDDIFNLFYSAVRENLVHSMFAVQGVTIGLLGLYAVRRARMGGTTPTRVQVALRRAEWTHKFQPTEQEGDALWEPRKPKRPR